MMNRPPNMGELTHSFVVVYLFFFCFFLLLDLLGNLKNGHVKTEVNVELATDVTKNILLKVKGAIINHLPVF